MGGSGCMGCHAQRNKMLEGPNCIMVGGPCPHQKQPKRQEYPEMNPVVQQLEQDPDCNPDD